MTQTPLSSKPFDIAAAAASLGAHIIDAFATAPGTCRLTTSPGHARLAQAALIQAGYEAARAAGSDSQLTATLPEPEWPAGAPCSHCGGPTMAPTPGRPEEEGDYCPACGTAWAPNAAPEQAPAAPQPAPEAPRAAGLARFRRIADGNWALLRSDGTEAGHLRRTTPAHATFTARWAAFDTDGIQRAAGCLSRGDAAAQLLRATAEAAGCPAWLGHADDEGGEHRCAGPAAHPGRSHDARPGAWA